MVDARLGPQILKVWKAERKIPVAKSSSRAGVKTLLPLKKPMLVGGAVGRGRRTAGEAGKRWGGAFDGRRRSE